MQYHIVIVTKYRRKVLTKSIRDEQQNEIIKICVNNQANLVKFNGEEYHIHLLVQAKPTTDISKLMQEIKGTTARQAFQHHPEIKRQLWGGHLWSPSYYIGTISETTSDTVKQYIDNQGKK